MKDVRQSIHDAIYQINQNANEAVDLAQIKFGIAVTDPTSPISGYIEGTVYFNVGTGIIWRLSGGAWVRLGNMKAIDNIAKTATVGLTDTYTITYKDGTISTYNVENGISVTDITKSSTVGNVDHYDVNLSDGSTTPTGFDVRNGVDGVSIIGISKTGTTGNVDYYSVDLSDGTVTPTGFSVTNGKDGVSVKDAKLASTVGNTRNYNFELSDGTLTPTGFSISDGVSSYLHVRYSAQFDGTGMVSIPDNTTDYIGICVTNQSAAPTNPTVYNWTKFVGSSGSGTGDMLKSDFATKYPKTTDRAAALFDGTNEILANQLMALAIYASNGNAGVVDKAAMLVDLVNGKVADSELLANFSDDGTELKYKGNSIGGKVDIDGASIIENASGQLEVSVDNDTIYLDTANKRIYVKPKFTTGDDINLSSMTAPETVALISSNEAPKTLFNKISTMIKNLRWLLAKYGSADISSLGQGADIGTITGALVDLNSKIGSGGGGFFELPLNVTADAVLVGGKARIFQVDPNTGEESTGYIEKNITSTSMISGEWNAGVLGKFVVKYGSSFEYDTDFSIDDFVTSVSIDLAPFTRVWLFKKGEGVKQTWIANRNDANGAIIDNISNLDIHMKGSISHTTMSLNYNFGYALGKGRKLYIDIYTTRKETLNGLKFFGKTAYNDFNGSSSTTGQTPTLSLGDYSRIVLKLDEILDNSNPYLYLDTVFDVNNRESHFYIKNMYVN